MCFYPPARVRIIARAAIAVITDGPRFLLVRQLNCPIRMLHRPEQWVPLWKFPGGGLNADEHPRRGASRELREETAVFVPAYLFEYLDERNVPSGPEGMCRQYLLGTQVEPKLLDPSYPNPIYHKDKSTGDEFEVWSIDREVLRKMSTDPQKFLPPQKILVDMALARLPA